MRNFGHQIIAHEFQVNTRYFKDRRHPGRHFVFTLVCSNDATQTHLWPGIPEPDRRHAPRYSFHCVRTARDRCQCRPQMVPENNHPCWHCFSASVRHFCRRCENISSGIGGAGLIPSPYYMYLNNRRSSYYFDGLLF